MSSENCSILVQDHRNQGFKLYSHASHGPKYHSSQIHIETYQLVRNQFLLISLMCNQHHQWNELVCLKQNQVCIHCPSFLDEHFSSTKRGRKKRRGRVEGGGLQWRRTRRENDVWQSRNLPLHWDMIGFSLVQERQQNKIKMRVIENGALKTKMRQEEGDLLAGMWCWLLCCCVFLFLFRKATLGFDAVVVIRGLAAATGFGLWALLDVRLRHTPPGGEVEGYTPSPRENPVPLQSVPLQLFRHLACDHLNLNTKIQFKGKCYSLSWFQSLTCSVLVWNSLSSSSVRGRKLSSFSGYSCQPMAFSNLHKHRSCLLSWLRVSPTPFVWLPKVVQCPTCVLPPGSWTGVQCLSHWGSRTDRSHGRPPRCRLWALGYCFHPDIRAHSNYISLALL